MVVRKCDICGKIFEDGNVDKYSIVTVVKKGKTTPESERDLCPVCMDTLNTYIELMKNICNSQK